MDMVLFLFPTGVLMAGFRLGARTVAILSGKQVKACNGLWSPEGIDSAEGFFFSMTVFS